MKIVFLFVISIVGGFAAPWLEILFAGQPDFNYQISDYKGQQYRRRQGKGGKERWKSICRTINPDPYAFPGRVPYPAGPVCPW